MCPIGRILEFNFEKTFQVIYQIEFIIHLVELLTIFGMLNFYKKDLIVPIRNIFKVIIY